MSTLAHVMEAAGLATIALGSIREQLYNTAPPRGLWCDFPLGRPLGRPGDAAFQQQVLDQAFGLLAADSPTIEDFPEAITDDGAEVLACSMPPRFDASVHPAVDEARGIRQAYDRAASAGDRIGAGRVVEPDGIPAAIEAFIRVADGTPWKEAGIPGVPARVAQDIRGYYETAAIELAEHSPAAWAGTRWFLGETEAGAVIKAARDRMAADGVKQPIWYYLIPAEL
ncbi:MAG: hypothetical protein AAF547_01045 [Actinomycetota bacterium]